MCVCSNNWSTQDDSDASVVVVIGVEDDGDDTCGPAAIQWVAVAAVASGIVLIQSIPAIVIKHQYT